MLHDEACIELHCNLPRSAHLPRRLRLLLEELDQGRVGGSIVGVHIDLVPQPAGQLALHVLQLGRGETYWVSPKRQGKGRQQNIMNSVMSLASLKTQQSPAGGRRLTGALNRSSHRMMAP